MVDKPVVLHLLPCNEKRLTRLELSLCGTMSGTPHLGKFIALIVASSISPATEAAEHSMAEQYQPDTTNRTGLVEAGKLLEGLEGLDYTGI